MTWKPHLGLWLKLEEVLNPEPILIDNGKFEGERLINAISKRFIPAVSAGDKVSFIGSHSSRIGRV